MIPMFSLPFYSKNGIQIFLLVFCIQVHVLFKFYQKELKIMPRIKHCIDFWYFCDILIVLHC